MEATVPGKLYDISIRPSIVALLPEGDEAAVLLARAAGDRIEPGDRRGRRRARTAYAR